MTNTVLHITLPCGLALIDGRKLDEPITYDVVSNLDPFYASVEQVKLLGGAPIRRLSDLALAGQIYTISKQVELLNYNPPNNPNSPEFNNFTISRNQWVAYKSAYELTLSMGDLLAPGSHVLANFSVTKTKGFQTEGLSGKLADLKAEIKFFEPAIRSGGVTVPGGFAKYQMAAKGLYDWDEQSPGRLWNPFAAGANFKSGPALSATGGRGKGVNTWCSMNYMPFMFSYRMGTYQGGFSYFISNSSSVVM